LICNPVHFKNRLYRWIVECHFPPLKTSGKDHYHEFLEFPPLFRAYLVNQARLAVRIFPFFQEDFSAGGAVELDSSCMPVREVEEFFSISSTGRIIFCISVITNPIRSSGRPKTM